MACPMLGPQLAAIGQARAYASIANSKDVEKLHEVSFDLAKYRTNGDRTVTNSSHRYLFPGEPSSFQPSIIW